MSSDYRRSRIETVDGIPALVIPAPGPMTAGIMFRVGRGDDPTPKLGITHLIEHLTLHRLHDREYEYNGMVSHVITQFICEGDEAEVVDFLTSVCNSLADLPVDRLEDELRVLAIESNPANGISPFQGLSSYRFGVTSLGSSSQPDFGATSMTADDIERFRLKYFTRKNAVLWFTGEPPAGLALNLPAGEPFHKPYVFRDKVSFPVFAEGPEDSISVSFEVERGAAAGMVTRILEQRLFKALRTDGAVSYTVSSDYSPISADRAVGYIEADINPDDSDGVTELFVQTVIDFLNTGATQEEVSADVRKLERTLRDPVSVVGHLMSDAEDFLLDCYMPDAAEQVAAVTVDDTVRVAASALRSLMFLVPEQEGDDIAGINRVSVDPGARIEGTAYSERSSIFAYTHEVMTYVVNDNGISAIAPGEEFLGTILFEDLVVLEEHRTGVLRLIGIDDMNIVLFTDDIDNGDELRRRILDAVPADRRVEAIESRLITVERPRFAKYTTFSPGLRLPVWARIAIPLAWLAFFALMLTTHDTEPVYPFALDALFWVYAAGMAGALILSPLGFRLGLWSSLVGSVIGVIYGLFDLHYDPPNSSREIWGSLALLAVSLVIAKQADSSRRSH